MSSWSRSARIRGGSAPSGSGVSRACPFLLQLSSPLPGFHPKQRKLSSAAPSSVSGAVGCTDNWGKGSGDTAQSLMSLRIHTPELPPCAQDSASSALPLSPHCTRNLSSQSSSLRSRGTDPRPIPSAPGVQTPAVQTQGFRPQASSLRPRGSGLRSPLSDLGVQTQTSSPRQGAVWSLSWLLSALPGSFLGKKHIHPAQICPDVCEESRLYSLCSAPQGPLTIYTHRELPNLLGDSSPDDLNCVHPSIIQSCRGEF